MPLFYRFGADDMREGGLTREEGKKAAHLLEQAGIDVLDVSGGLGGDGQRNAHRTGLLRAAGGRRQISGRTSRLSAWGTSPNPNTPTG